MNKNKMKICQHCKREYPKECDGTTFIKYNNIGQCPLCGSVPNNWRRLKKRNKEYMCLQCGDLTINNKLCKCGSNQFRQLEEELEV